MKSLIALLLLTLSATADYVMPVGIPDPASRWTTIDPIDTPVPVRTTVAPGWFEGTPRVNSKAAGDAWDCYYVDQTHGSATDTANTYGHPNLPRLTIPSIAYNSNSYVEIHGGGAGYSGTFNPRGTGTSSEPIWFVGIDSPSITVSKVDLGATSHTLCSYMLFDSLQFRRLDIRPRNANNAFQYIAFRNCVWDNDDGAGSLIGLTTTTQADATQTVDDVVIYDCILRDTGNWDSPNEEMGINITNRVTHVYVLDTEITDIAEDGIQAGHASNRLTSDIFVGRCYIHDNLTNAIDYKGVGITVISESVFSGHQDVWVGGVHKSTGQGETIGIHYANESTGPEAWDNFPEDTTIVNNTITGGRYGIATSRHGRLRITGNVITAADDQPSDYTTNTEAILINGCKDDTWVCHNTIYGSDGGIRVTDGPAAYNAGTTYYRSDSVTSGGVAYVCIDDDSGTGISGISPPNATYWKVVSLQVWGNIVSGRTETDQSEIDFDSSTFGDGNTAMDYNLAYYSSGEVYHYGNSTARDLAYMIANTAHQTNGLDGDPLFTNAAGNIFTLQSGSPCIGAATEGTGTTAYADYLSRYGLSIAYDRAGTARPQGGTWDIGAYEYMEGASAVNRGATRRKTAGATGGSIFP